MLSICTIMRQVQQTETPSKIPARADVSRGKTRAPPPKAFFVYLLCLPGAAECLTL